jgi:hypothetical protein
VAVSGLAVDAAIGGIERGIQGERAVAVVLEAVAFGASRRERQDGIETIQSLNGGLLIDAEHGRVLRRAQIEAEDVGGFAFELGIVAGHVAFETCGFRPASCQTRCTASLLRPNAEASLRQLQCVDPSLGFLRVADRMRARRAGVSTLGFWPG